MAFEPEKFSGLSRNRPQARNPEGARGAFELSWVMGKRVARSFDGLKTILFLGQKILKAQLIFCLKFN